jgi:uncharacterized protein
MSSSDTATLAAAGTPARGAKLPPAWLRRLLAIVAAWSAAWWLLLGALIAPALPGHWSTVLLLVTVLVLFPFVFIARALGGGAYPSAVVRLLVFRPFWYTQLAVPLMTTSGALAFLAAAPFGMARQAGQTTALVAGGMLALFGLVGYIGSRRLRVVSLQARFSDLPEGLEGLRIVQVSDLHVGPHTPRRHLEAIARAVGEARPDIIAITGDQVDDYPRDVEPFARAFGGFAAPLGVYAIAGNHDVYAGWPEVRAGLEAMGAIVLVNEARPLEHNGARFWLAGTGDPAGIGRGPGWGAEAAPDIPRTLASVPADGFTIALAHNPALWPELAARGVRLTLSGHTHYGQFSIPALRWSLASVFLDLAMGSYRKGQALLYINPGTNYWGLPLRIGALPEVTVVTLTAGRPGEANAIF